MPTKTVLVGGSGKIPTVSSKNTFDFNRLSETDPSKIGQGQSEKERKIWGEAEQFGGKQHTANIIVKPFYK